MSGLRRVSTIWCMLTRVIIFLLLISEPTLVWAIGWFGKDLYGTPCHGLQQGFGPYDYNDPALQSRKRGSPLSLVEGAHYDAHVQLLIKGNDPRNHTSNVDNLDYTLRAVPNHHKALWTMIRWYLQQGRPRATGSLFPPVECYLQRAIKFRPKDAVVYMLYGIYLHLAGMPKKAAFYYKKSLTLDPDSGESHYNYGLLLLDQKRYKAAVKQAQLAYNLGYPLPGLRNRLRKAGYELTPNADSEEAKKSPVKSP